MIKRFVWFIAITPFIFATGAFAKASFEAYDSSHLEAQREILLDTYSYDFLEAANPGLQACPTYYEKRFPFEVAVGDQNFGADVKAEAYLKAGCEGVKSGAEAEAEAHVFEERFQLMTADLAAQATKKVIGVNASLYALGYEIASTALETKGEVSISGNPQQSFDEDGNWQGAIGPVPVILQYGVAGNARLNWKAWANILTAKVQTTPKVTADAYMVGGIGTKRVVAFVVGGKLSILTDTMDAMTGLEIAGTDGAPELIARTRVANSYEAMKGSLNGRLTMFDQTVYERDFFLWDGIKKNEVIYEAEESIAIPMPKAI